MKTSRLLAGLLALTLLLGLPLKPASTAMPIRSPADGAATGSGLLPAAGQEVTLYDGRWFGRAPEDACGQSWAMDINVRSGKVTGRFWRGGVLYDVYGEVDANGRMASGRGGKSSREFGIAAPRFLSFDLAFLGNSSDGFYGVTGSGGNYCQSPLALQRSEQ